MTNKNFKQTKEELEKGCGFDWGGTFRFCGKDNYLCSHCNSKLEGLNLGRELTLKEVEGLIDYCFPKSWMDKRTDEIGDAIIKNKCGCPDVEKFVLSIKKELKQKLKELEEKK